MTMTEIFIAWLCWYYFTTGPKSRPGRRVGGGGIF